MKPIMGYQKKSFSTPAMKGGKDNEEKARKMYVHSGKGGSW